MFVRTPIAGERFVGADSTLAKCPGESGVFFRVRCSKLTRHTKGSHARVNRQRITGGHRLVPSSPRLWPSRPPFLASYISGACQDYPGATRRSQSPTSRRGCLSPGTVWRGNFLQSCWSKAARIIEDGLPESSCPRLGSIQPHARHPQAAKLKFSSQSSSLSAIVPPGDPD